MQQAHFSYNKKSELQRMIRNFEKLHNCKFEQHICELDINPEFGYKPSGENFKTDKGCKKYVLSRFSSSL